RIDQRKGLLALLREEVGAGVVASGIAGIDVEQARQPASADPRSPCERAGRNDLRRIGHVSAGQAAKRLVERSTVIGTDEVAAILGVGISEARIQAKVAHWAERRLKLDALR